MSTKRLSPKEIKQDIREDEFRTFMSRTLEWVAERPQVVLGIIGGILALVAIVSGARAFMQQRSDDAQIHLAKVIDIASGPVVEEGADPDAKTSPTFASEEDRQARLEEALGEVGSGLGTGAAAEVADLYRADIAAASGDMDAARGIWESFLKSHDDHLLAATVRLNLIRLDRANGAAEAVAEQLERELVDPDNRTLPEDVVLYELAKTHEVLGQQTEAQDLYQRIVDEHPESPYASRARQLTAEG